MNRAVNNTTASRNPKRAGMIDKPMAIFDMALYALKVFKG
jgi:hypothetical protein